MAHQRRHLEKKCTRNCDRIRRMDNRLWVPY